MLFYWRHGRKGRVLHGWFGMREWHCRVIVDIWIVGSSWKCWLVMRGRWVFNWCFCIGWRRCGWQCRHGWRSGCWCWWRYGKSCRVVTRIAFGWWYTLGWRCCVYGLLGRRRLVLNRNFIAHGWRYMFGWRYGYYGVVWRRVLIVIKRSLGFGLRCRWWSYMMGELVSDRDISALDKVDYSIFIVHVFIVPYRLRRGRHARAIGRRRYARAIGETGKLLCNTITDVV